MNRKLQTGTLCAPCIPGEASVIRNGCLAVELAILLTSWEAQRRSWLHSLQAAVQGHTQHLE